MDRSVFNFLIFKEPSYPSTVEMVWGVGQEKLPISLSDNPQLKSVLGSQVFCQSPCKLDQFFTQAPDTPS